MKPKSTDPQATRRKNAILGALFSTVVRLTTAAALLWMHWGRDPASLIDKVLVILMVLALGSIPFIWISLKTRLKEIQGGEEDAASQY